MGKVGTTKGRRFVDAKGRMEQEAETIIYSNLGRTLAKFKQLPRILLVEDEKSIRDIIVPLLFSGGFDCREAETGRSAIDLLGSGVRINLVLSNLLLPEVDGFTLLLHVKRNYPKIPFVFVTAITDTELRQEVMLHGADGFVQKPFECEQLLAIVRSVLGNE